MGDRYALMWSGGKDSALALQRAGAAGIEVARLINYDDAATGRVRFHATRVEMVHAQAHAVGIELRNIASSWPEMEGRLAEELATLRSEGFAGVVLGDIHRADVRAWYEERVRAAGLQHLEAPLGRGPRAARQGVRRDRWPRRDHVRGLRPTRCFLARAHHRRALH